MPPPNLPQELRLDCPSLRTLDAAFCARLESASLARALSSHPPPPLTSLNLSVCYQISSSGLSALAALALLQVWTSDDAPKLELDE